MSDTPALTLQDLLNGIKRDASELGETIDRLEDENAKLREQLDYVTPIAWYAASERERDRMRELGIEVCDA